MNEQIKELAEHCDFYIGNEHYDKSHKEQQRFFMEKFAKLIVQECAEWIKNTDSNEEVGEENAAALLNHFGIKD